MPHQRKKELHLESWLSSLIKRCQAWIEELNKMKSSAQHSVETNNLRESIRAILKEIDLIKFRVQCILNDEAFAKKHKDEIDSLAESKKIQEKLQEAYEELQKKKEALEKEKELERLMAWLAVLNQRSNKIWQEKLQIVANMITNLDKSIDISLREIPGASHLIDHENEENNIIRISRRDLKEKILSKGKVQSQDDFEKTAERIMAESAYELFWEKLIDLGKIISTEDAPKAKAHVMNVLEVESTQVIRENVNFVEAEAQFNIRMNEHVEVIKEIREVQEEIACLQKITDIVNEALPAVEVARDEAQKKVDSQLADKKEMAESVEQPTNKPGEKKESVAPASAQQADKTSEKKEMNNPTKPEAQIRKESSVQTETPEATNKKASEKPIRKKVSTLYKKVEDDEPKKETPENSKPSISPRR